MNTPIVDFVEKYISSGKERLHMPGHKGASLLGFEGLDITEIPGADVLYHASGIIKESMDNASKLFGSGKTVYSAEGSSLSIRAMLYLAVRYAVENERRPLIFAMRNAHKVFVMSAALLDFEIKWLCGKSRSGITECIISPPELERELMACKEDELPCALYVTSPDYLGNTVDIGGISEVCKKYGVLLLVDNAHGAYLNFLPESRHPINLGADICCDSAHKTLPALTGAGYLHISKDAPQTFSENAMKAMSLFASTSPSYLILQSLDAVNGYLGDGYREKLWDYCEKISALKERLICEGIPIAKTEPLKIRINPKKIGYTGEMLGEYLYEKGIVCEFYDPDNTVLMLTPENGEAVLEKIYNVLKTLPRRDEISEEPPRVVLPERVLSVKKAIYGKTEKVPLKESEGRIYGGFCVSCPPAVPIAVCGERVDGNVIALMEYYGCDEVEVII